MKVQIAIRKQNGRNKALFRLQMTNGEYPKMWHRMTVPEAKQAIATGTKQFGLAGLREVEVYKVS